MAVPEITVQELAQLRTADAATIVLDVREADELATAQIVGAQHIPLAQLSTRIAEIPADQPVYVLCHHGGRSERAVRFLQANGRPNAVNVEGGIDAWSQAIDPTITRY